MQSVGPRSESVCAPRALSRRGGSPLRLGVACLLAVWTLLLLPRLAEGWLPTDVALLLSFAAATAVAALFGPLRAARAPLRHLTLGLAIGFAGLPAWIAGITLIGLLLGLPPRTGALPGAGGATWWVAAVVLAPLFEEIVYRERLLGALAPRVGSGAALVGTSLVYALPQLEPWNVLGTFLVGLALGVLWLARRSLWLCVGVHAGLNLAIVTGGAPPQRLCLDPASSALAGAVLVGLALRVCR